MKLIDCILEQTHSDYLSWKRKNVTLRGVKELGNENGGGGRFGSGLYTAYLSNKKMAKEYGKVYFVVNAIPKNAKVLTDANQAEIFLQNVIMNWCKSNGFEDYNPHEFALKTSISQEMLRLGYDGLAVRGREMVNYSPPDNVKYFETEEQLKLHYINNVFNRN